MSEDDKDGLSGAFEIIEAYLDEESINYNKSLDIVCISNVERINI